MKKKALNVFLNESLIYELKSFCSKNKIKLNELIEFASHYVLNNKNLFNINKKKILDYKLQLYIKEYGEKIKSFQHDSNKCWLWPISKNASSHTAQYPSFSYKGISFKVHRASFLYHYGDLPSSSYIYHHCANTNCVNPAHLYERNT